MVKPCELPCPKCGSADVYHHYRAKGEIWSQDKYGKHSKYASGQAYTLTSFAEHIEHHCRGCQFDWQTKPLSKRVTSSTTAERK